MGKNRGIDDEGSNRRTYIIIGAIAAVVIVGFGALVYFDSQQRGDLVPAEGVETFDVGKAGQHVQENVDYEQDPPVGGEHNNIWQNAGFYTEPVRNETAVHTLEHGGVWITYDPELPEDQVTALSDMVEGQECLLASPYPGLPEGVPLVASAWGVQTQLTGPDDPNLERFIRSYLRGPQTPEPGAACTNGTGDPA